jgi:hypothetical protein
MRVVAALLIAGLANQSGSWLDRPLENWNRAGAAPPQGTGAVAAAETVQRQCQMPPPTGAAADSVAAAGWIPLLHQDRSLTRDDIEIVAGATAITDTCWLQNFHLFVFVGGHYAGTLSPVPMTSQTDGWAGPVRFVENGISVEFARYGKDDTSCCPGARMTVRYQVTRGAAGAVVAPVEIRTTRSY